MDVLVDVRCDVGVSNSFLGWVVFSFVLGNSFPSFSLRQDVCYLFVLPAFVGRRCVECGLTFYSCVSEVAGDGDVLEGAELEVPVAQRASLLQRRLFTLGMCLH